MFGSAPSYFTTSPALPAYADLPVEEEEEVEEMPLCCSIFPWADICMALVVSQISIMW